MNKILLVILILAIFGCTQKILEPGSEDYLSIEFKAEKVIDPDNQQEYSYHQDISWSNNQNSSDYLYAYRITTTDDELPTGLETDEDGWVLIDDSIWSMTDELHFEFTSENSILKRIISKIEVKAIIDNEELSIVEKRFRNNRIIGTNANSSAGNIDGQTTGTGIKFHLNEQMTDIFVEGLYAHHFMYRLNIINEEDSTLISAGEWFNTIDLPDIRRVYLHSETEPSLQPNIEGELTQFEAYIVTRSGYEDIDNPAILNFTVQEGFYPNTLIYNGLDMGSYYVGNNIYCLGENQFQTYNHYGFVLPYEITPSGVHYASPFWGDLEGNFCCINSDDLQIYMHWGWVGEYEQNNPQLDPYNMVFDETTNCNYFSEITYFDVRLDGEPLYCSSLPAAEYNFVDNDGTEWLRIPKEHELSQKMTFSGLDSGTHTLVVRAVDLQPAVDETPAEFTFELVDEVPADEKEGIAVLYDMPYSPLSPLDEIMQRYEEYFVDYSGTVDYYNREELWDFLLSNDLLLHNSVFSPTYLQNYETIIYVSDVVANPGESNFHIEYEGLNLYLQNGGNIILSCGANLDFRIQSGLIQNDFPIFEEYFGIDYLNDDAITAFNPSFLDERPFFNAAVAADAAFGDIELELPSFNFFVNNSEALGPVAYFNEDLLLEGVEVIYTFGSIPVGDEPEDPTQAEYDFYTQQPVAIKKETGDSKFYIFGFPLSFMETDQVKENLSMIINEIENEE